MEDLVASLAGSFSVTSEPNSTAAPHPRFSQYKVKGNVLDQAERRKRMLDAQKKQRFDYLSYLRNVAEDDWTEDDNEIFGEEEVADQGFEEMECEVVFKKPGRRYKNQLMLSEWMVEVPEDFEKEWILVNCPVGKRSLVVASMGNTRVYTRSGYCVMSGFPSTLPGGNRKQLGRNENKYTVLDCIYSEVQKTFYILDIMCWAGYPVMESETEFRFFWLNEKVKENPEVTQISKLNSYCFLPLPYHSCDKETISRVISSNLTFELDGLLFYHKRTSYTFGTTPLCLWLKGYMLPEILGIQVPAYYMQTKPSSYSTFSDHILKVKADKDRHEKDKEKALLSNTGHLEGDTKKKKSQRAKQKHQEMEIENVGNMVGERGQGDNTGIDLVKDDGNEVDPT